jgi:hypothetical protein
MHNNACFGVGPAKYVKNLHFLSYPADGPISRESASASANSGGSAFRAV